MNHRKLTAENYRDYLATTYASWLGKVIGVRLGAPIENLTSEQIRQQYSEITGYPVQYDIFAADDDLNGPLFFVRALLEKTDLTASDIGNVFLNYIQRYTGFFWWGGVGVSTEHTAYENLLNGISAPESGSCITNGKTIAEQIGGQIFSDCWGYVAGYDPKKAAELAGKASSVTHDGNGIQGGIFVAVAITLAYQMDDIHEVLQETLNYLDQDMEYCLVCRDIIRFYRENSSDWQLCLKYIQDNYGYDRYPGVCHIIPNAALMIMAMCYGNNDFSTTLCMLAASGWDTDCNCGNVGSIMGALVGIEGIEEKWIIPIKDIVNASSCVGCLNIQTVSESAQLFSRLAYKLVGLEMPAERHFCLPYGTEGFLAENVNVTEKGLKVNSREIRKYAYYLGKDVDDARYDPVYSPTVYGGDRISFDIESDSENCFRIFVQDCEGRRHYSPEAVVTGSKHLSWTVPVMTNMTVNSYGLQSAEEQPYYIKDYCVSHHNELEVNFADYKTDEYGPRWGGDSLYNIRAFVPYSGSWKLQNGLLEEGSEMALITTGHTESETSNMAAELQIISGNSAYLVLGYTGFMHFSAVGIEENKAVLIRKNNTEIKEILGSFTPGKNGNNRLQVQASFDRITIYINDRLFVVDDPQISLRGGCGFMCRNSRILIKGFKLNRSV